MSQPNSSGIYTASKGGTEQMFDRLQSIMTDEQKQEFQIICSRVRDIEKGKKRILWLHDRWEDPEAKHLADPISRSRFSKLVFVSDHQFQTYHQGLGVPHSKSTVIKNGIEMQYDEFFKGPAPIIKPTDKIRLIYHTTPHRGLEILLPVFDYLCSAHPNIHLDLYSSYAIYGWKDRDENYRPLFEKYAGHPKITNHGTVSNSEIRQALRQSHIFAFPSIWPETSCLAAIEAMAEQCLVVCPRYAALAETVGNYGLTYDFAEDINEHANRFARMLDVAIRHISSDMVQGILTFGQRRVQYEYEWANIAARWQTLFMELSTDGTQAA